MRARLLGSFRLLSAVVLPLLMLAAAPLSALDIADGRIRLTLDEGIGCFSISCQTKGSSGVFVPLLASQDPRTSFLSIVVGNKLYRMGESSEFSEKAEKVPGGARFVWKSSFLQVTETFTIIPSLDSSVGTGARIDLSIKNFSEQDITAGARYLLDTYLGEPSSVHFRTPSLSQLTHELTLTPADKTAWWASPIANDPDEFGLQVMMSGTGITVPNRVVFANWKRLSDSSWAYETSAARDFSLLPYSVNDSAVAQYYEPRSIPRSGEITITLALGLYSKAGYGAVPVVPVASPPTTDFAAGVQQSLAEGQNAGDDSQAVHADLSAVNTILNEVNAKIGGGGTVSDDELALIESALKELQSRAGRFAPAPAK
ncbi:MAG: hypothetical protein ABSG21_14020 [Spirochaetia bacterium]|jgi:hypothetical protein